MAETEEYDIAVIGGGTAANAAVTEALSVGASVAFIETRAKAISPHLLISSSTLRGSTNSAAALAGLALHLEDSAAWWLAAGTDVIATASGHTHRVRARRTVLAERPRPRIIPFPGWELEGVLFTVDASNACEAVMLRAFDGHSVALTGSGPHFRCTLSALQDLGTADHHVINHPSVDHLVSISAHGGDGRLNQVVVNGPDTTRSSSRSQVAADFLVCVHGSVPSIRLASAAGCRVVYDPDVNALRIATDENCETSVRKVYVAGGSGIAAEDSRQGRLAAAAAALSLDWHPRRLDRLLHLRKEARSCTDSHEPVFSPQWDDIVVCPCEGTRLSDLKSCVGNGLCDLDDVRKAAPCASGLCQGEACDLFFMQMIAPLTNRPIADLSPMKPRWPSAPIPLGVVANLEI